MWYDLSSICLLSVSGWPLRFFFPESSLSQEVLPKPPEAIDCLLFITPITAVDLHTVYRYLRTSHQKGAGSISSMDSWWLSQNLLDPLITTKVDTDVLESRRMPPHKQMQRWLWNSNL